MTSIKNIYFIYDNHCSDCKRMKQILEKQAQLHTINIVSFNSETDEAVNFAIENNIDDLPACKIGKIIIQGSNFTEKEIIDAITGLK